MNRMQAIEQVQRELLGEAGLNPEKTDITMGRLQYLREHNHLDYIELPQGGYHSSLFIHALAGLKPNACVIQKQHYEIAKELGMPALFTPNLEKVKGLKEEFELDVPFQELYRNLMRKTYQAYIVSHDKPALRQLFEAVINESYDEIGRALGYPDAEGDFPEVQDTEDKRGNGIFLFPRIKAQLKREIAQGRNFEESLLYIEYEAEHTLSDKAIEFGKKRKKVLLAAGCEFLKHDYEKFNGTELADIMAKNSLRAKFKKYHKLKYELTEPEPALPDLKALVQAKMS